MTEYHEPQEELDDRVRDLHRALSSLKEEIEAVDWYNQRAARAADPALRRVIEHNRNEEIEHAVMTLEWLRRTMPEFDDALRTYLFMSGDIVAKEAAVEHGGGEEKPHAAHGGGASDTTSSGRGLGVGSLREARR